MTDDEVRKVASGGCDSMSRRRGESEQRALGSEAGADRNDPVAARDDRARGASEETADGAVAIGARHEDRLARAQAGGLAGFDDLAE